jgi:hypothetical protein
MKKVTELTGSDEKFVSLKEEAIRDLVYFYAESGDFKNAKDSLFNAGGNISIQAEKSVYVGSTFPNYLFKQRRSFSNRVLYYNLRS